MPMHQLVQFEGERERNVLLVQQDSVLENENGLAIDHSREPSLKNAGSEPSFSCLRVFFLVWNGHFVSWHAPQGKELTLLVCKTSKSADPGGCRIKTRRNLLTPQLLNLCILVGSSPHEKQSPQQPVLGSGSSNVLAFTASVSPALGEWKNQWSVSIQTFSQFDRFINSYAGGYRLLSVVLTTLCGAVLPRGNGNTRWKWSGRIYLPFFFIHAMSTEALFPSLRSKEDRWKYPAFRSTMTPLSLLEIRFGFRWQKTTFGPVW